MSHQLFRDVIRLFVKYSEKSGVVNPSDRCMFYGSTNFCLGLLCSHAIKTSDLHSIAASFSSPLKCWKQVVFGVCFCIKTMSKTQKALLFYRIPILKNVFDPHKMYSTLFFIRRSITNPWKYVPRSMRGCKPQGKGIRLICLK